jgi:hypothetical protein
MNSLKAWQIFFLTEGLFFLGLSLGIFGSTNDEKSKRAAWVLFTVGLVSVFIAFVLWGLQMQKDRRLIVQKGRTLLKPIRLKTSFDSLLQTPSQLLIFKGRNFISEARVILQPTQWPIPAYKQLLIHHCGGMPLELEIDSARCRLEAGEIIRLSSKNEPRQLNLRALDSEDEELAPDTRAPQLLFHGIEEQSSAD